MKDFRDFIGDRELRLLQRVKDSGVMREIDFGERMESNYPVTRKEQETNQKTELCLKG